MAEKVCPDCGTPWDIEETPNCEGCGLNWEDLKAAVEFMDRLDAEHRRDNQRRKQQGR